MIAESVEVRGAGEVQNVKGWVAFLNATFHSAATGRILTNDLFIGQRASHVTNGVAFFDSIDGLLVNLTKPTCLVQPLVFFFFLILLFFFLLR